MHRHHYSLTAAAVLLALVPLCLWAGSRNPDLDQIRTIQNKLTAAWDSADAAAIAQLYTDDGDVIIPTGLVLQGKQPIRDFYASVFASGYAGSRGHGKIVRWRAIGSTAYVVDGTWSITGVHKRDGKSAPDESGIFNAFFSKSHGRWQLAALREQTSATKLTSRP